MANYSFCELKPGTSTSVALEPVDHPQLQQVAGFWDVACIRDVLRRQEAEAQVSFVGNGIVDVLESGGSRLVPITTVQGKATFTFKVTPEMVWFQPRIWKVPEPSAISEVLVGRPSEMGWIPWVLGGGALVAGLLALVGRRR